MKNDLGSMIYSRGWVCGGSHRFAEEYIDRNIKFSFEFHVDHSVRDGVMCVPSAAGTPPSHRVHPRLTHSSLQLICKRGIVDHPQTERSQCYLTPYSTDRNGPKATLIVHLLARPDADIFRIAVDFVANLFDTGGTKPGRGGVLTVYEYICEQHGTFDVDLPMGHATERFTCLVCGREARRFYSAPMTQQAPRHLVEAIDRAEKSRDEPEVVSSLPRRPQNKRTPTAPLNPALRKLPRP